MTAQTDTTALAEFVRNNLHVVAAWLDHSTNPPTLRIRVDRPVLPGKLMVQLQGGVERLSMLPPLANYAYDMQRTDPITDLRCPVPTTMATNGHQRCQNEPVLLGTQIQPAGAPWVGTAGLPVKWNDPRGNPAWGFLSNWHVMCPTPTLTGHTQHQPNETYGAIGFLADWNQITRDGIHYLDAAIADSYLDGFHTIANGILGIGEPNSEAKDAYVGIKVIKSGRTTTVTTATCIAIGAAVKVSYGGFTATFADQDVYEGPNGDFSAPGDSGSCILSEPCHCPTSLLFAGGGKLTIGNPIRYAIERFNLVFPFN